MIKLLYITNGMSGSGGLERVLSIKASLLSDKFGYEVHILTLNDAGEDLFYRFSENITFHDISAEGSPLRYFHQYRIGIKNIINKVQPDVISVCDDGLKGLLFPLVFGRKVPLVYERHVSKNVEFRSDKPSFIKKVFVAVKFKLMELGGGMFNKFVVLTQGNLNEWNLNNLAVIPNPASFKNIENSELNQKRVLVVGKQSFQKGYDRLLDIWGIVNKRFPEWQLEIYGKKEPLLKLEEKVLELGLEDKVFFYDPIKNINDKYKHASLYLMTSRYEGFGMVLIEAMSFGVPCISFDCPYGPGDIIIDGKNGYLIPEGDINLYAKKVIDVLCNQELRYLLGDNAKLSVENYAPDMIVSKWDKLFQELKAQ